MNRDVGESKMNEKTYFGLFLIQGIASFIPSIAIAYFLMKLLEEGRTFFWIVLIAIYVFYFLVWVVNTIIGFFSFFLFKNRLINEQYSLLVENQFPNPKEYGMTKGELPERYYESITNDASLNCELRMLAAVMATGILTLRRQGYVMALLRAIKVHEKALKKYCKEKNLTVSAVKCSSIAEIVQSAKNGSDCGVLPFRE